MAAAPRDGVPDFAELGDAVSNHFALGEPTGPLALAARGEQGLVWRLDTTGGSFAVKQVLVRATDADLAEAVGFQERVASATPTFEVAQPVRSREGDLIVQISGHQVSVQTWLDMLPADPGLDPASVGRLLAGLHLLGEPRDDSVDPWYTQPVGRSRWEEHVRRLESVDTVAAGRVDAARPELVALEGLMSDPGDLRTCHRDLFADNLRATPTGRLCVFDWDNAGPADPAQELGVLVFEFGLDDPVRIRALYDGYLAAGGPGRIRRTADLTMLIAQVGHFYELAIAAYLRPDAGEQDHAYADSRLDELEERPLTVSTVEQIVEICCTQGI